MFATPDARIAGSVSGGCVESATAQEIASAIATNRVKVVEYGVSDETAWDVGLSCGGKLQLLVEPCVRPQLVDALTRDTGVVAATIVAGAQPIGATLISTGRSGQQWLAPPSGEVLDAVLTMTVPVEQRALAHLASGTSRVESMAMPDGTTLEVFFEVHASQPQLVVFGGVHVAEVLVPMAKLLGFRTVVADAREAFLTHERFPNADELILGWPDEVFHKVALTPSTFVCVLTHDPKFDDPAVTIALQSDAAYVGVIGSARTQRERRERLRQAGLSQELIDKLHGPIGLDLGGREPNEIALAILAQITQVRRSKASLPAP
jgi:xanthine dehydrogenase accessory factor